MKFAVIFEDNPDADPEIRRTLTQAHLEFLEKNGDVIETAGPCTTTDGQPAGGLWIVDCASAADVDSLISRDPFWPTGLRKSVRILAWRHIYANGRRQV